MDNRKQIILLIIAIIMGGLAAALGSYFITTSINKQTEMLREEYDAKQKEMVAAIQAQTDQRMALLSQQIEANRKEQAAQLSAMQTKLAQVQAQPPKKKQPSLAIKTPAGKRAVSIKIDSLGAVGGLLNPGDLVDVIASLNVPMPGKASTTANANAPNADRKDVVTAMVFQSLQVLAVNTNLEETGVYYDEQQRSPEVKITVAVDPDEAGMLIFADKNGKLQLALRSPQETERQMVKASTWKTLADYVLENQGIQLSVPDELKTVPNKADEKPAEKRPSIQIFRGGKEL